MEKHLIISNNDNVAVALSDFKRGELLTIKGETVGVKENISVKHKMALKDFDKSDVITMYGVPVGVALKPIAKGRMITTDNTKHVSAPFSYKGKSYEYTPPKVASIKNKTFGGYHRKDGQVGVANYWVVIPMVFCQNRNLKVFKDALESELGYKIQNPYRQFLKRLVNSNEKSFVSEEVLVSDRVFPNVDGIKFMLHEGGCGGTKQDTNALVDLLAGYIKNPNVAGATIMSLGCQHAQIDLIQDALKKDIKIDKPVYYFEQQSYPNEPKLMTAAIKATYEGLQQANELERKPASLSKLCLGLECGGSDGFSGITANPLIGLVSDKINAVGGKSILSEFPELCGVEQDIINRCSSKETALKFINIMETYAKQAKDVGSGFDMNPSPGNVRDGLITDAIKSAGAATKGGRAPVADVLEYAEYATKSGLNLLCTPGNDVESTTGLTGAGANIILFSTGLGTPTGNPITPVIKISTNSMLPNKMTDIIDFDAGRMISEQKSMEELSEELIDLIIEVASGKKQTCAVKLGQDDFIPWKRGVSL